MSDGDAKSALNGAEDPGIYSFGPFSLDVRRGELSNAGRELPLRPKSFDVLHYLVKNPCRLVSRNELLSAVWPQVVVTDDSLTQCLIEIRRALNDNKDIIRTVHRRGYIFDTAVDVRAPSSHEPNAVPAAVAMHVAWRLPSGWTIAGLLALALALGGTWWRMAASPGSMDGPGESTRSPPAALDSRPDPRARELYTRGRLFYGRRMQGDVMRAQHSFEQALEIDPAFAAAWVSLAATINLRFAGERVSADERLPASAALPRMRAALERALALDPDEPEALWRMSRFEWREGDHRIALDYMRRALEQGANHAAVLAMAGGFAFDMGYSEIAVRFLSRAALLDPISATYQNNLAIYLHAFGRLEEAEAAYREALELKPDDVTSMREGLAWISLQQQDLAAAAILVGQLPAGSARDEAAAVLYYLEGEQHAADEALERLLRSPEPETAQRLARAYAVRGDADATFRWLAKATEVMARSEHGRSAGSDLTLLRSSTFLRPLHADPRWADWLADSERQLYQPVDREAVVMLQRFLADSAERSSADAIGRAPP